jgi:hypothetical protein
VGARHSLTSLHASSAGLHGLLHHIHGRATGTAATAAGPMAPQAGGAGEARRITGELAAVRKRLVGLLELRLRWQRALRGMRRRGEAAKRGLLAVEALVIHRIGGE